MGAGREQHDFHSERRGVILGMFVAVVVMLAAALATWLVSNSIEFGGALAERLRLGATAALLPAGVVAFHIGRIASRRFNSSDLIAGAAADAPESRLSVDKALLSNSVEQAVIAISTYLLLALVLPAEQLVFVLVLAVLFVIGRIFFTASYTSGAAARSFGFALTFYPTVAGMVAGAAMLLV